MNPRVLLLEYVTETRIEWAVLDVTRRYLFAGWMVGLASLPAPKHSPNAIVSGRERILVAAGTSTLRPEAEGFAIASPRNRERRHIL